MSATGEEPKSDRIGKDYEEGPNPAPGGVIEPGGLVPPYEGRQTEGSGESTDYEPASEVHGKGGTASPAVESPAREDELAEDEPESPKGVGESHGTRGEDVQDRDGKERGRHDTGTDEQGRPEGKSDSSDQTGI